MPCRDGGPSESECTTEKVQLISSLEEMLCSACRALETKNFDFDLNPMLSKWWAKHKKADEARQAKEIKERNEYLLAKGVAESTPVSKLRKEHVTLLKKHGFL